MPYLPEGELLNKEENRLYINNPEKLPEALYGQKILEAKALICDREHNLRLNLGGMRAVIPREDGAIGIREGSVRDIAIISRVNRPVCFVINRIEEDENGKIAILSREKAQRMCFDNYIDTLAPGDIIDAKVSRTENFGVFADIGCGVAALMPIDAVSVSRIEHPGERFRAGMNIKAVVKSIENGRISLSHKELLGTWAENAAKFSAGETVTGIVRSIESYGSFIELTPNLAGLAEVHPDIREGMRVSVYIKSIIERKMKIKLIIIDTFDDREPPKRPEYFLSSGHIDRFVYSPESCPRVVETVFE
ncbi:MAG: S1 RNA-binding domain-containing protein [Ruminococcus sp.]|nr:S1 RNA-binding domain-containing protein [Ruminococcus sp.]